MRSATLLYNTNHVLRRRLWFAVLLAVAVFLFTMPILAAFSADTIAEEWRAAADNPQLRAVISSDLNEMFRATYAGTSIPLMLAAVLAGLVFFSYLHSRKHVDMFHSLPLKREKLFAAHYLAGAAAVLIPYIVNLLLTILILALSGLGEALNWSTILGGLGMNILFFFCTYAISVLAAVLTGHLLVHVMMCAYLLFVLPAASALLYWFLNICRTTWYSTFDWDRLIFFGSPFTRWFATLLDRVRYYFTGTTALVLAVVALLLSLLALFLYKRYPSESAEKALAFPWLRPLIKYPVALLVMVCLSLVFYEIGGTLIWFIIGAVLGGFISCQTLEMLYYFDFSGIRRKLIPAAALILLYCLVGSYCLLDLGGYNSYLPREDEIDEIELQVNISGSDFAGNLCQTYYGTPMFNRSGYYYNINVDYSNTPEGQELIRRDTQALDVADPLDACLLHSPEAKSAALTLAGEFVREMEEGSSCYYMEYQYTNEYGEPTTSRDQDYGRNTFGIVIRYKLNNGREVARCYYNQLYVNDYEEELAAIFGDQEYLNQQFNLLAFPAEQVWVESIESAENYTEIMAYQGREKEAAAYQEATAELMNALQEELPQLDFSMQRETPPIAMLRLRAYNAKVGEDEWMSQRPYRQYFYPVYPYMSRTIAALAGFGVEAEDLQPKYEQAVSVEINSFYSDVEFYRSQKPEPDEEYSPMPTMPMAEPTMPFDAMAVYEGTKYAYSDDSENQRITDPEEIRYWLDHSFTMSFSSIDYDPTLEVYVTYLDDDGVEYTRSRNLPHPQ